MPTIAVTLDTSQFDAGITRVKRSLADLEAPGRRLNDSLKVDSSGIDKANQGLSKTQSAAGGAAAGMAKLKTAVAGLGIAAALQRGIDLLGGFDERIRLVGQIAGATEGQFESLRQKALALGESTRFSATEAAGGLQALAQAGQTVDEIISTVDNTLNLAVAATLSLEDATRITVSTMGQFKIAAE